MKEKIWNAKRRIISSNFTVSEHKIDALNHPFRSLSESFIAWRFAQSNSYTTFISRVQIRWPLNSSSVSIALERTWYLSVAQSPILLNKICLKFNMFCLTFPYFFCILLNPKSVFVCTHKFDLRSIIMQKGITSHSFY